jgi:hypothetical protein
MKMEEARRQSMRIPNLSFRVLVDFNSFGG